MTPEDIIGARFSIVPHGFDRDEVLEFLRGVAAAHADLERDRDERAARDSDADTGEQAAPAAEGAGGPHRWQPFVELLDGLATTAEQVLDRAEREAEQTRQHAQEQARCEVERAREQAAAILRAAEERAASREAEAHRQAEEARTESRAAADRLRTQAHRAGRILDGHVEPGAAPSAEEPTTAWGGHNGDRPNVRAAYGGETPQGDGELLPSPPEKP